MYCVVLETATLSNINLWLGGEVMLELKRRMPGGASSAAGEYGSLSVINSAAQRLENKVLLIERSFSKQRPCPTLINLWLGGEVMLELKRRMPGGASPAAGEYGSLSVINSAAQRLENKVLLIERSFLKQRPCPTLINLWLGEEVMLELKRRMPGGASPAAGEYGSLSVINSAAQRLENKVLLIERSFVCALSTLRRSAVLLKKQEISIFDICSSSVPAMLYYLLTFLILRTSLLIRCYHWIIPLYSLYTSAGIEPIITAVEKCASRY